MRVLVVNSGSSSIKYQLFDMLGENVLAKGLIENIGGDGPAVAAARADFEARARRHGGFTEGADADMSDAELRAAGRHRSARQLPTYAKRTRNQLISGAKKRRAMRTNAGDLSE